jgi:hypothetical protein
MKCIYRYSNYIGQAYIPEERHNTHTRESAFYKKIEGEQMVVLYQCLPHNANRYEKREIHDAVKRGEVLENKQHNNVTKYNELEVEKTEEFKKIEKKWELPKGRSVDKNGFRVRKTINGKPISENFKTLDNFGNFTITFNITFGRFNWCN